MRQYLTAIGYLLLGLTLACTIAFVMSKITPSTKDVENSLRFFMGLY